MFEFEFIGTLANFNAFKKRVLDDYPDCGFQLVRAEGDSMFCQVYADPVIVFQVGLLLGELSKDIEA